MKRLVMLFFLTSFLHSCAIYRRNFDCPVDKGVPCTSLIDLEMMIIETKCGPDLFLDDSTERVGSTCHYVWINDPSYRGGGYYCCLRCDADDSE